MRAGDERAGPGRDRRRGGQCPACYEEGGDGVAHIGLRIGQGPRALALQANGKILVSGVGGGEIPNTSYLGIARLRRDGRPDRTFSRDGISIVDYRGRDDAPTRGCGAGVICRGFYGVTVSATATLLYVFWD